MAPLTGLAIRELWLSLRLVPLLAISVGAGLWATLVPSLLPSQVEADPASLAWGITVASLFLAAVAAGTISTLRRRGVAGWLVVRSVPRGSIIVAWGLALTIPVILGLASAAVLGWLTVSNDPFANIGPTVFAAVAGGAVVAGLQAGAIGLACGSIGRPVVSAALAVVLAACLLLPGMYVVSEPPFIPTAGLGLLAQVTSLAHPLSDGVIAMGLGLGALAALTAIAAAAFERTSL